MAGAMLDFHAQLTQCLKECAMAGVMSEFKRLRGAPLERERAQRELIKQELWA